MKFLRWSHSLVLIALCFVSPNVSFSAVNCVYDPSQGDYFPIRLVVELPHLPKIGSPGPSRTAETITCSSDSVATEYIRVSLEGWAGIPDVMYTVASIDKGSVKDTPEVTYQIDYSYYNSNGLLQNGSISRRGSIKGMNLGVSSDLLPIRQGKNIKVTFILDAPREAAKVKGRDPAVASNTSYQNVYSTDTVYGQRIYQIHHQYSSSLLTGKLAYYAAIPVDTCSSSTFNIVMPSRVVLPRFVSIPGVLQMKEAWSRDIKVHLTRNTKICTRQVSPHITLSSTRKIGPDGKTQLTTTDGKMLLIGNGLGLTLWDVDTFQSSPVQIPFDREYYNKRDIYETFGGVVYIWRARIEHIAGTSLIPGPYSAPVTVKVAWK